MSLAAALPGECIAGPRLSVEGIRISSGRTGECGSGRRSGIAWWSRARSARGTWVRPDGSDLQIPPPACRVWAVLVRAAALDGLQGYALGDVPGRGLPGKVGNALRERGRHAPEAGAVSISIYITDQPLGMTGPDLVTLSPWLYATGLGILLILFLFFVARLPSWWHN